MACGSHSGRMTTLGAQSNAIARWLAPGRQTALHNGSTFFLRCTDGSANKLRPRRPLNAESFSRRLFKWPHNCNILLNPALRITALLLED